MNGGSLQTMIKVNGSDEAKLQADTVGHGDEEKPQYNNHTIAAADDDDHGTVVALADLSRMMADFASERDWEKFHSPRNLLLALVGEVGELSEIFQWKGEVAKGLPDWAREEREHLGEELSDVLLYLVRLADICNVNLGQAALRKLKKNAIKYPVDTCLKLAAAAAVSSANHPNQS